MSDLVLCGDCGGTNTRLSLYCVPHSALQSADNLLPGNVQFSKKYLNEHHGTFAEVCHLFLNEARQQQFARPVAAIFACAGPVMNQTVIFTNKNSPDWKIHGPTLEKELNIPTVKVINDFAATGYGLLTLKPEEYIVLNDQAKEEGAPIATIGAGTGLGECFLTAGNDGTYSAFACEGGHADFAPANELEEEMYNWMKEQIQCKNRLSVERVVSGMGVAQIYSFLAQKFPSKVDAKIQQQFDQQTSLQAAVVGQNADKDELCNMALEIFAGAYGREAGNALLKYLPRGGFFITGGIAQKNLRYFTKKSTFVDSMFDKGRVSPALRACPVYLVLTEELGERGVHFYACQLLMAKRQHRGVVVKHGDEGALRLGGLVAVMAAVSAVCMAIGVMLGRRH